MNKEIERKFLVTDFPSLYGRYQELCRDNILQGYLAIEPDGSEVRLRAKGQNGSYRYFLTAKNGQGLVRGEAETEISQEKFDLLWPMTEGRRVEKTRFTLALSETLKLEVDRFDKKLEGLVIAEIEFPTEAKANAFQAPVWLRDEVTSDKRFKNQNLATLGSFKDLRL